MLFNCLSFFLYECEGKMKGAVHNARPRCTGPIVSLMLQIVGPVIESGCTRAAGKPRTFASHFHAESSSREPRLQ